MSFIVHIGNTVFGMYQIKYNKEWDKALKALLAKYSDNATLSEHTLFLGNYEIWISNQWYCYGHLWRENGEGVGKSIQYRPSVFTMRKLDKLVRFIKDKEKKEQELTKEQEMKDFLSRLKENL